MFISLTSFGQKDGKDLLEIYYFHRSERCLTCSSIEAGVVSALSKYGKEIKKGNIVFQSINIEEDLDNEIVKIRKIESPTLIYIYNIKGERKFLDLTEQAFTYARANPKQFIKILRDKINDFFR